MSDLQARFETAAQEAQALRKRPDNLTLLELYALYKQATAGNVSGQRPGMLDAVARAKFDAWAKKKGMAKDAAITAYIALVEKLKR